MPARVQEDEESRPVAVKTIYERTEEEAEWWEPEPVFKMHYQVTLEEGRGLVIFRHMKTSGPGAGGARQAADTPMKFILAKGRPTQEIRPLSGSQYFRIST